MKRTIIILIFLIGFWNFSFGQSEKTKYLGINLFPILGTTLELGYELNIKPKFSIDFYTGYVFNSNLDSPHKLGSPYKLDKKSGVFLKLGTRCNIRNSINKFAPFIGINIVNSIAIEKGIYDPDFDFNPPYDQVMMNSYNLGVNGIIGITSPA
ncbi:MAG: hypothetical protein J7K64_02375, partial [Bacteroidales bacterium]|nr:hypothetical protein [Bacteroidales bacterium]